MMDVPRSSIIKRYRMNRHDIFFVKFILEAYDGIATMTTIDAHAGIVDLYIGYGCENDVQNLIHDLSSNIRIEPMTLDK